jgi:putative aldouronate transport system substrate-binding protein
MSKKMNKAAALLLSAAMSVSLLAGCGSANESTSGGSASDAKVAESSENNVANTEAASEAGGIDTSEHVDLKMYLIGDRAADFDAVYAEVNKILEEKLNCSLTVDFLSWSEHDAKYSLLFSGGEDFDLIFTASQWAHYEQTVALGGFYPMDEAFRQTYAPGVMEAVPELGWEQAKIGGQPYMVPYNLQEFGQEVLAIRGDLMEQFGIETVSNWEEYMAFNLACAENGIYGSQGNAWWQYFQGKGKYIVSGTPKSGELFLYHTQDPTDTNIYYTLDSEDFVAYCKDMKAMADAGSWSSDILNSTDERQAGLLRGTVASMIWNMKTCRTYAKQANAEHPDWNMTLVDPMPNMPKKVNAYINGGMAINANSKHKERAMMVINEFYTNKTIQDLTMLGIEGKHWEAVGEDQYKILDASGFPTDNNCNWGWKNQNLIRTEYIEDRTELDDIYDAIEASYLANVKEGHPLDGFSFDITNVSTQFAAVEAACGSYYTPLITGLAEDVDATLAEWKSALDSAGIQDIADELNVQIEAYLANK